MSPEYHQGQRLQQSRVFNNHCLSYRRRSKIQSTHMKKRGASYNSNKLVASNATPHTELRDGYYLLTVNPDSSEFASQWGHTAFIVVKDNQITLSINVWGAGGFSKGVKGFLHHYVEENHRPVLITRLPSPKNIPRLRLVGHILNNTKLPGGSCSFAVSAAMSAGGYNAPRAPMSFLPNRMREWAVSNYAKNSVLYVPSPNSMTAYWGKTITNYANQGVTIYVMGK